MEPELRKVTERDVDILYRWANDATVRQNAFHTEPIPYEAHCAWFADKLADKNVLMYLLCRQEEPLGQIRLSIEEGTALIDYSVDVKHRGHGYGTQLVLMAQESLRENRMDVKICKAQVKYENPASARVFEKCGFDRCEMEHYIEFTKRIRG